MFSVAVGAATVALLFGAASAHAESTEALAAAPNPAPEAAPSSPNSEPAPAEPVDAEPAVEVVESAAAVETAVEKVEQVASAANPESPVPIEPEVAATPIRRVTESAEKIGQGAAAAVRKVVDGTPAIGKDGGALLRAPIVTAVLEDARGIGAAPVAARPSAPSEQPDPRQVNLGSDGPRAGGGGLPLAGADLRYLTTPGAAFDPSRFMTFDFGDPPMGVAYRYLAIGDSGSAAGERSRNLTPANGNDLVPPPTSPQSAAAGSGGSSSFVPVAALLALLALAVPATCRRFKEKPAFPAPAPFVCALERPG